MLFSRKTRPAVAWLGGIFFALPMGPVAVGGEAKKPRPATKPAAAKPHNGLQRSPTAEELRRLTAELTGQDEAVAAQAEKRLLEIGGPACPLLRVAAGRGRPGAARAAAAYRRIEKQTLSLFMKLSKKRGAAYARDLKPQTLAALQQEAIELARYAPQVRYRRLAVEWARRAREDERRVRAALRTLARLDARTAAKPAPTGVAAAALEVERVEQLSVCRRFTDAIQAAEKALSVAPPERNRFAPMLLARLSYLYGLRRMPDKRTEVCRRLLKEFPTAAETAEAHEGLLEVFLRGEKWEAATKQAAAYLAAFPRSRRAWRTATEVVELLEEGYQYERAAQFAELLLRTVPLSGLSPRVPRAAARCREYVSRDYAAAAKWYKLLRDIFPDRFDPAVAETALKRVARKAAGKFPAEPKPTAAGPAGALARLLAAVRKRDVKALPAVVSKELVEEYRDELTDFDTGLTASFVFADFVLPAVEEDEKAGTAVLHAVCRPWNGKAPIKLRLKAVKAGKTAGAKKAAAWVMAWDGELPGAGAK